MNERNLTEWGNRFTMEMDATGINTLTLGSNFRYSVLANSRERIALPGYQGALIGLPVVLPPLFIDDRTVTTGFFFQDSQRFSNDKLIQRLFPPVEQQLHCGCRALPPPRHRQRRKHQFARSGIFRRPALRVLSDRKV